MLCFPLVEFFERWDYHARLVIRDYLKLPKCSGSKVCPVQAAVRPGSEILQIVDIVER